MNKIEHQTGMTFSYDPAILKGISRDYIQDLDEPILYREMPLARAISR